MLWRRRGHRRAHVFEEGVDDLLEALHRLPDREHERRLELLGGVGVLGVRLGEGVRDGVLEALDLVEELLRGADGEGRCGRSERGCAALGEVRRGGSRGAESLRAFSRLAKEALRRASWSSYCFLRSS